MTHVLKNVVLDVDGVFTDGSFLYSCDGKRYKTFGAHDSDGIKCLRRFDLNIFAISADERGFGITRARMADMGIPITLVSEKNRYNFVSNRVNLLETAFIADGAWDASLLAACKMGIVPANAVDMAKDAATFILKNRGGQGAVFEASELIIQHEFGENEWKKCFEIT